jgi:hypothetical protein
MDVILLGAANPESIRQIRAIEQVQALSNPLISDD